MITVWRKFVGWKLLEHFLNNPTKEFYLKELSRILDLSPASAKNYCDLYEQDQVLISIKRANARMFYLNNDLPLVKAVKRFYFLMRLNEEKSIKEFIKLNPHIISLVLYGSYSSGDYDEKSDVDFFVLSDTKINRKPLLKLQKSLGKQVQLTVMPLVKWLSIKDRKDNFAASVLLNNIPLCGAEL